MKKKVNIVLIFCLAFLGSCSKTCEYKVTDSMISSNCTINNLSFCKITVDSLSVDSFPVRYHEDTIINFFQVDESIHSKEIYFTKENNNYFWMFEKGKCSETNKKAFPLKLKKNTWYLIWGVKESESRSGKGNLFFIINKNNKIFVKESYPSPM